MSKHFSQIKGNLVRRLLAAILVLCFPFEYLLAETPYRIMPNDVMRVEIIADTTMSGIYRVTSDGTLALPLVREVSVVGLTLEQAAELLDQRYQGFINNPRVNISIEEYEGHIIYVMGAVKEPGPYPFPGRITLLQAITMAGGYIPEAKLDGVRIIREAQRNKQIIKVNLSKLMRGKAAPFDIELQSNDVVEIPFTVASSWKEWAQVLSPIITVLNLTIALINSYQIAKQK